MVTTQHPIAGRDNVPVTGRGTAEHRGPVSQVHVHRRLADAFAQFSDELDMLLNMRYYWECLFEDSRCALSTVKIPPSTARANRGSLPCQGGSFLIQYPMSNKDLPMIKDRRRYPQ